MNSLEILYQEYQNDWIYPISKTIYFKRMYGNTDYTEYELLCGHLSFYATNAHLFPLRIYYNRMQEHYIASVQFGTGKDRRKAIYHEERENAMTWLFQNTRIFPHMKSAANGMGSGFWNFQKTHLRFRTRSWF